MFGHVMHARLFPRENKFRYGIYYMALPLSRLHDLPLPYNKFGLLSFYDKDHGARDGSNLEIWARNILKTHKITEADGEITLICMPRVLGYVFNPVSFWLCHDKEGALRTVLCEVNNTFGERHTYICAHDDHRPILKTDTIKAEKLFFVSPFIKREGSYTFRFDTSDTYFKAWIDYFDLNDDKMLVTALSGDYEAITKSTRKKAFWSYPLVTFKATSLIHWQAIKLIFKKIKYISKPKQKTERMSTSDGIK